MVNYEVFNLIYLNRKEYKELPHDYDWTYSTTYFLKNYLIDILEH